MRYVLNFLVGLLLTVVPACRAGEAEAPPKGEPDPKNVFKIGKVTCYKAERRVELDGKICLREGALEYLAVLAGGKEYESVLSFDCKAVDLNLAMIGLGYKAAGGVRKLGDADVPKGDPLYLAVEWKTEDGKTKRVRAEELLFNQATKKPMRKTAWVFTGSDFARDPDDPRKLYIDPETKRTVFLADIEKNLIAVYRDPLAIFNSPLNTGVDGIYYQVNKEACPKVGTPVKLIMEPAPKEALDPENLDDGAKLLKREEGADYSPGAKPAPVPKPEKDKDKDKEKDAPAEAAPAK